VATRSPAAAKGRAPKTSATAARPGPTKDAATTRRILSKLEQQHPNADTELNYRTPFELLAATILSAQCTDERVNQVTPALFARYGTPRALAGATAAELEPIIKPTGFFRAKSKSLIGMATAIAERHGGEVPKTMAALVELPGVGRKTANVVLGHALGVPGLPVDRHVLRVSNRIGIAAGDDPVLVEQQLCAALPPPKWIVASDTLILHGRRICKPRPQCDRCAVREDCDYYRAALGAVAPQGRKSAGPQVRKSAGPQVRKSAGSLVRGGASPKSGTQPNRSETGSVPKLPRAATLQGTGRGGAASGRDIDPAAATASLAEAKPRRGAPRQIKQ
jgi:endonuclease-3